MAAMRAMMQKLKLTVNEAKTHVCRLPDESFDFLGYTIGRCYAPRTGRAYLGTRPSRKKVLRLCREISEMTGRRWTLMDATDRVSRLNRMLVGWANYFCLGPVSKAYRIVDRHVRHRLRQWLCAKHKVQGQGTSQYPDEYLEQTLGLIRLQTRTQLPVGDHVTTMSESRMREIRPSGSMSGVWKRSMAGLLRHRQTKGPATARPYLNHRATPRLYPA